MVPKFLCFGEENNFTVNYRKGFASFKILNHRFKIAIHWEKNIKQNVKWLVSPLYIDFQNNFSAEFKPAAASLQFYTCINC